MKVIEPEKWSQHDSGIITGVAVTDVIEAFLSQIPID